LAEVAVFTSNDSGSIRGKDRGAVITDSCKTPAGIAAGAIRTSIGSDEGILGIITGKNRRAVNTVHCSIPLFFFCFDKIDEFKQGLVG
jgi:hypothetical protein